MQGWGENERAPIPVEVEHAGCPPPLPDLGDKWRAGRRPWGPFDFVVKINITNEHKGNANLPLKNVAAFLHHLQSSFTYSVQRDFDIKGIQNPQIMVILAWPDSGTFGEFQKYT